MLPSILEHTWQPLLERQIASLCFFKLFWRNIALHSYSYSYSYSRSYVYHSSFSSSSYTHHHHRSSQWTSKYAVSLANWGNIVPEVEGILTWLEIQFGHLLLISNNASCSKIVNLQPKFIVCHHLSITRFMNHNIGAWVYCSGITESS